MALQRLEAVEIQGRYLPLRDLSEVERERVRALFIAIVSKTNTAMRTKSMPEPSMVQDIAELLELFADVAGLKKSEVDSMIQKEFLTSLAEAQKLATEIGLALAHLAGIQREDGSLDLYSGIKKA